MSDSAIPANPNLDYDRKRAKRLLSRLRDGDLEAIELLRQYHPRFRRAAIDSATVKLSDVHLAIAREYGCASWPRWKRYVEIRNATAEERVDRFLLAACSNDVTMARSLLQGDADLVFRNAAAAAAAGNVAALASCLDADPDAARRKTGPFDAEPIVWACQSRLPVIDPALRQGVRDCVRMLLDRGADPNGWFLRQDQGPGDSRQTALYGAAGIMNDAPLTGMLLSAGADPDDGETERPGETLYHVAEFDDTECLERVLQAGPRQSNIDYCLGRALDFLSPAAAMCFLSYAADVDLPIPWFANRTHLMKAIRNGAEPEVIETMLDRTRDLEIADDNGLTPYRYAVRFGHPHIAAAVQRRGADTGRASVLDRALGACLQADEDTLNSILADHPDLPRHLQAHDREMMAFAARQGNHAALPLLSKLGLPVDSGGMPALHEACFCGDFEAVRQLVEAGASLTSVNEHGGDALGAAIYGSTVCHDVQGGPKSLPPEVIDPRGYARIVAFLLDHGAPLPNEASGSAAVMATLQEYGVS